MKKVKITSHHVGLDVMHGRKTIQKHLAKGGECDVIIKGKMNGDIIEGDDGVSINFYVNPENVEVTLIDK